MRDKTYDIAKALMMLWVVWGHLMRYEVVEYDTSIYMLNAKIGVNMPVFFVIGGCLASLTFTKADWPKLMSRTIHFLWPQFAVAIVPSHVCVSLLDFSDNISHNGGQQ